MMKSDKRHYGVGIFLAFGARHICSIFPHYGRATALLHSHGSEHMVAVGAMASIRPYAWTAGCKLHPVPWLRSHGRGSWSYFLHDSSICIFL
jgi:hypothetical protein